LELITMGRLLYSIAAHPLRVQILSHLGKAGTIHPVTTPPPSDAELKAAAAHWHHLCDTATNVIATCTDGPDGPAIDPAADPTKIPGATPDAQAAIEQLRAVVTGPDATEHGIILHEVDTAARRVSAAIPVTLTNLVGNLLTTGGGEPELALMGALMTLNTALHDLDQAIAQLGDPEGD
jgi:hypothetical protein